MRMNWFSHPKMNKITVRKDNNVVVQFAAKKLIERFFGKNADYSLIKYSIIDENTSVKTVVIKFEAKK